MDELKKRVINHLELLKKNPVMLHILTRKRNDGMNSVIVSKDARLSEQAREDGNLLFLDDKHDSVIHHKILHRYNRSIAFAPHGSEELATAYERRSKILQHIRKYAESITEIDKALKITESLPLKIELLCRKADCCTALGLCENRNILEKAKFIHAKLDDSEDVKGKLSSLIEQTQAIVDANKLDEPKEIRKVLKSLKITAEADKDDVSNNVKIERNEKYGTHLVALRDFEPWEVLAVEKPFMNNLHESRRYLYCSNCCKYLWVVYPCDHCAWRLYCSEDCKHKALSLYHDTECHTLVQMKAESLFERDENIPFIISIVIKAIQEAGSIDQLQRDLENIQKCEDTCTEAFSAKQEVRDYHSVYDPLYRIVPRSNDEFENQTKIAVVTLMGLAKYSSIFSTKYDFNEIDKLVHDDAAMFVGALIIKTLYVVQGRRCWMHLVDPNEDCIIGDISVSSKCIPGGLYSASFLRSIKMPTIRGCSPNIHGYITHDNKYVMYSSSPIKKGTPLIETTGMSSIYCFDFKSDRRAIYENCRQRTGNCPGCTEDWLGIILDREKGAACLAANLPIARKLMVEQDKIDQEIREKRHKLSYPDSKLIMKAKENAVEFWKHFPMPSLLTFRATQLTRDLIGDLHSPGYRGLEKIESCRT